MEGAGCGAQPSTSTWRSTTHPYPLMLADASRKRTDGQQAEYQSWVGLVWEIHHGPITLGTVSMQCLGGTLAEDNPSHA